MGKVRTEWSSDVAQGDIFGQRNGSETLGCHCLLVSCVEAMADAGGTQCFTLHLSSKQRDRERGRNGGRERERQREREREIRYMGVSPEEAGHKPGVSENVCVTVCVSV